MADAREWGYRVGHGIGCLLACAAVGYVIYVIVWLIFRGGWEVVRQAT